MILVGIVINVIPVCMTCFIVPLGMGSNIWPIAGVFWCALAGPVAAVVGLLGGLFLRRTNRAVAITVVVFTAAALSIAIGIIISRNR